MSITSKNKRFGYSKNKNKVVRFGLGFVHKKWRILRFGSILFKKINNFMCGAPGVQTSKNVSKKKKLLTAKKISYHFKSLDRDSKYIQFFIIL